MLPWRTAIATSDTTNIWVRGREITSLMRDATFTDMIVLLHLGRLATPGERRLLDAILIGVADHGSGAPSCAAARLAASGNRQSVSAAIAAGVLTIGDEHGGAGSNCMELIAEGLELAGREGITVTAAAQTLVERAVRTKRSATGTWAPCAHNGSTHEGALRHGSGRGIAGAGVTFMRALEEAAGAAIKPLPINIDGALAAVLHDIGFPPPAGKFIFIIGRVAGLTAEVAEEYERERPMRIKFAVEYDGVPPRSE